MLMEEEKDKRMTIFHLVSRRGTGLTYGQRDPRRHTYAEDVVWSAAAAAAGEMDVMDEGPCITIHSFNGYRDPTHRTGRFAVI